jgi:hypothetical protein
MEIDYLNDLKMTQGAEELVIVETNDLQDSAISSMTMLPARNGVHVASVIPSRFFSYTGTSNAVVSGVVYLKLAGSRRRLSVNFVANPKVHAVSHRIMRSKDEEDIMETIRPKNSDRDKESPFIIDVQLVRELKVASESSSGTMMSGIFGFATVFSFIAAYNMVMCMTIR